MRFIRGKFYRLVKSKMYKIVKLLGLLAALICVAIASADARMNIGSTISSEEIAGWDIDVRPDGLGLPDGSGSVESGEILYEEKCVTCHGSFGEGEGRWPVIAGGIGTLIEERPEKTVGSYWPYVSTLWDYIHRAMPFLQPQTLTDDEVYALTAYVLYLNEQVDDDFVLTRENLPTIELPNQNNFFDDPRPDVHNTRCMTNCLTSEQMSSWSTADLGVTPVEHLGSAVFEAKENSASLRSSLDLAVDIYQKACALCHSAGVAGAPVFGDKVDWRKREEKGLTALYENALRGYQGERGYMPPKGGNPQLTDEMVRAAVDYMISGGDLD